MAPKMWRSLFLIHHIVHSYMHNSKTKGRISTFYLSKKRYMWDRNGELWIQRHITTTFWYYISCLLILITRKLQVVCRRSTYQMTALLSLMINFCVRTGCEIWLSSYGSKHAPQSLSDKPLCMLYKHKSKNIGPYGHSGYRMTTVLLEKFRVTWWIWLESCGPRHALVVLWYNVVCILQAHAYIVI